jgi:hypothetical protein
MQKYYLTTFLLFTSLLFIGCNTSKKSYSGTTNDIFVTGIDSMSLPKYYVLYGQLKRDKIVILSKKIGQCKSNSSIITYNNTYKLKLESVNRIELDDITIPFIGVERLSFTGSDLILCHSKTYSSPQIIDLCFFK